MKFLDLLFYCNANLVCLFSKYLLVCCLHGLLFELIDWMKIYCRKYYAIPLELDNAFVMRSPKYFLIPFRSGV